MGDEGGLAAGDAAMPKLPKLKARAVRGPFGRSMGCFMIAPIMPLL
jgi:hypothetical protein